MPNNYTLPTKFTPDPGSSLMTCPTCFRLAELGELPPSSGRVPTFTIHNDDELTRHRRSFEHSDHVRILRLVDKGYSTYVRRMDPVTRARAPFNWSAPAPPLPGPVQARSHFEELVNNVLAYFKFVPDTSSLPTHTTVNEPEVQNQFNLVRYSKARACMRDGVFETSPDPIVPSNEAPRWFGSGTVDRIKAKAVGSKLLSQAREAWQNTADPVVVPFRYAVSRPNRKAAYRVRYKTFIETENVVMFKRDAMDRLWEWANLWVNELERHFLSAVSAGRSDSFAEGDAYRATTGDLLHLLMVLCVPYDVGSNNREFRVYGVGRKRIYLAQQPKGVVTGNIIKI